MHEKELLKYLKEKGLKNLLLINGAEPFLDPNLYYFTGAQGFENSVAVLGRENVLYVPGFEVERAEKESCVEVRALPKKWIKTLGKEIKGKTGVNRAFVPALTYEKLRKKIRLVDFSKDLAKMRSVKSAEEVKFLRKAARIALNSLKKVDKKKMESEIVADLAFEVRRQGAKFAFELIVAYDAASSLPHAVPGMKKGKKNLLVDLGAVWKGYHSDITRTFRLGKDEELEKITRVVKEAQLAGKDVIKLGVQAKEVAKEVKKVLVAEGYKLDHSVGHGVGLLVHEKPYISTRSKDVLEEGMVFTIEPGIYLKNKFGVRLEDMFLVTKKGCEVLSR